MGILALGKIGGLSLIWIFHYFKLLEQSALLNPDGTVTSNAYRLGGPDWVADMFWHMLVAKMPGPSALNKLSHEASQKHSAVSCPLFNVQRGMS